jgi:trans-aconitate methyltransferase
VYARYLDAMRGKPIRLTEIGVACGASLKMWQAYFPLGQIVGVDIREECRDLCQGYDRIRIDIADATQYTPQEPQDIVIDDGSHISLDIVHTFRKLWPHVKPGGLYVIEDLRCTFDQAYIESFEWPRNRQDFSRRHLMIWLDDLMRLTDVRGTDIDFIHYHREMLIIGKQP